MTTMPLQHLDELVREFLTFRGFAQSLKSFDAETRAEKEKGFRVDRIVDAVLQHISSHDLVSLRDLWGHLHQRVFCRLEQHQQTAVTKMEANVLKLYLVNCIQTKRPDKVREFFEKTASELQGQAEWKDWFALPFLANPESNPLYSSFFQRQWQDTLLLSLFNLLSIVFACLPPPRLAEFSSTSAKIKRLKEENECMRQKLTSLNAALRRSRNSNLTLDDLTFPNVDPPEDLMDDFYIIAQEAPTADSQVNTLKAFLRNITGGGGGGGGSVVGSFTSASSASQARLATVTSASPAGSSNKPAPLKLPKSRSSSKTRTISITSSQTQPQQQQPQTPSASITITQHTPVSRLSQTKSSNPSPAVPPTVPSFSPKKSVQGGGDGDGNSTSSMERMDKMAYLLLGQEEYTEHHSEVTHARFSTSGFVVASSDVGGIIKVWTATPAAPQTQATFISQQGVTALDWVPNSERHFLYGTKNGTIRLCDKVERRTTSELSCCGGNTAGGGGGSAATGDCVVQTLACSSNSCLFAASVSRAGGKQCLLVHDLKTMTCDSDLFRSTPSPPLLTSCVFNHNSQMLVAAGIDGKVRIFDLRKQDCISSWSVGEEAILSIALSTDETSVFAMTGAGDFSSWSLYQTGQRIFQHKLDDPYFNSVQYPRSAWSRLMAFAGDGRHMLTCSTSGGIIYEFGSSGLEKVLGLKGHREHAICTDWSSVNYDCGPCITAARDGHIRVSTLLSQ